MKKTKSIFKTVLRKWARMLSKNMGVSIVFSGDQPMTDGDTIRVFALPDEIPADVEAAIIGAIDHEAGHVDLVRGSRTNSPDVVNMKKRLAKNYGMFGPVVWNVFEDMRIEQNVYERFPGSMKYFEAVRRYMFQRDPVADRMKTPMQDSADEAVTALALTRFPRLFKDYVIPRASKGMLALVRSWLPFVHKSLNANTVEETHDIAVEFLEMLHQQADQSSSGDGDDEYKISIPGGSGEESASSEDGEESESSGNSEPGDEDDVSSVSGEKAGGGEPQSGEKSEAGSESDGDPSPSVVTPIGGTEKAKTSDDVKDVEDLIVEEMFQGTASRGDDVDDHSVFADANSMRELVRDSARHVLEESDSGFLEVDCGLGALEHIEAHVSQFADYRVDDQCVHVRNTPPLPLASRTIAANSKNLFPVISQQMRRFLLAKRANKYRPQQEYGSINPGDLHLLAVRNGPSDIFEQRRRGREVFTAATLLIDGSSSMVGVKSKTVMRCAYFFCEVLEKCHAKTEVAVFTSGGRAAATYHVVKPFASRLSQREGCFYPVASGGTPMAEAMVGAVRRLSERREERKLLFILTDGAPNGAYGDAQAFMRRFAGHAREAFGIETIGFGVNAPTNVARCFDEYVMLDTSRSQVESDFVRVMQRKFLGG